MTNGNLNQKVAGLTDYLSLGWTELGRLETWTPAQEGLTFVLPKEGAGQCGQGANLQSLETGDVLTIRPGVGGPVRATAGRGLRFWTFSVCLEHVLPLFASHEIATLQGVLANLKHLRVYPASSEAARMCHRLVAEAPKELGLEHRSQVLRAASAILAEELRHSRQESSGHDCMEDPVRQRFEALTADELLHLSVDDLARRFNCSRRHLNRLFHQHFGLAVANLRMELRLLKAVSLLRDPTAKVINVAGECGFNHLGLFTTCFRRRFGVSPSEWRRQAQQERGAETAECSTDDGSQCLLKHTHLCPCNTGKPSPAAAVPPAITSRLNSNRHNLVVPRTVHPPGATASRAAKRMSRESLEANGTRLHLQIDLAD